MQYEQTKGQPKPPTPEVQKMQMTMQIEQAKMQARQGELQAQSQLEQQKMQMAMELEKAKQEYQAQENQLKFQLEEQRNAKEAEMANNKDILLAYLDNSTKIETTRISQGLDDGSAAYSANVETARLLQDTMGYDMTKHPLEPVLQDLQLHNQQLQQVLTAIYEKLHTPKEVIRDAQGKIVGVK
jgi:cytochrome bd-type quinol oxidase subunit 1